MSRSLSLEEEELLMRGGPVEPPFSCTPGGLPPPLRLVLRLSAVGYHRRLRCYYDDGGACSRYSCRLTADDSLIVALLLRLPSSSSSLLCFFCLLLVVGRAGGGSQLPPPPDAASSFALPTTAVRWCGCGSSLSSSWTSTDRSHIIYRH